GVDTFTLRDLGLDPFQTLDYLKETGLEGAQFGGLRGFSPELDRGKLQAIRDRADELGLYSHVSLSVSLDPHLADLPRDEHLRRLTEEIEAAAAIGWTELHAHLGGGDERYQHPVPWTQHLADSAALIRALGPVLRAQGCRANLETHGDLTTFELVRLIEDVGPDIAGICLDTANVLCHCEDPVSAVKRAAPYTHLTHIKDGTVFFVDSGYGRQTLPPGRGALDWRTILPVLAEYEPDLPVSIEDHKWLFYFHCFDRRWLALHPDLTREEYAEVMQFAWRCHEGMRLGVYPDPEEYDKFAHVEEVHERLRAGAEYLKDLIAELGLRDRGVRNVPAGLGMARRG
ncbi:MAG: sugar phosphate isomerase/epimerase, partial [Armatimonadetes bacterium]|nr:sugar phosphate isomerase/epimerase [Armatimonadota bacterium]